MQEGEELSEDRIVYYDSVNELKEALIAGEVSMAFIYHSSQASYNPELTLWEKWIHNFIFQTSIVKQLELGRFETWKIGYFLG